MTDCHCGEQHDEAVPAVAFLPQISPLSAAGQQPQPERFEIRRFRGGESPGDFALARTLRTEVFIREQNVPPDKEFDCHEDDCVHWLLLDVAAGNAREAGKALATGRMRPYQEGCQMRPVAKLERIAVAKDARGQGVGGRLMRAMLDFAQAEGYEQALLNSQTHAVGFYEKLGFVSEGNEFEEAGILHVTMRRML